MTFREVPKSFEYGCDKCGVAYLQEGAAVPYANGRPPGWATLRFERDAASSPATGLGSEAARHVRIEKLMCVACADAWTESAQ